MTSTQLTQLSRVCTACGKERKPKYLRYDPNTFASYCENPYICGLDHPNAPKNLIERGHELALVDFDEVEVLYKAKLAESVTSDDDMAKLYRILTKPVTMRIQDPEIAIFLVHKDKEMGTDNISEVIRYCINKVRELEGDIVQPEPEPEPEAELEKPAPKRGRKSKPTEEAPNEPEYSPSNADTDVQPEPEAADKGWTF